MIRQLLHPMRCLFVYARGKGYFAASEGSPAGTIGLGFGQYPLQQFPESCFSPKAGVVPCREPRSESKRPNFVGGNGEGAKNGNGGSAEKGLEGDYSVRHFDQDRWV